MQRSGADKVIGLGGEDDQAKTFEASDTDHAQDRAGQ